MRKVLFVWLSIINLQLWAAKDDEARPIEQVTIIEDWVDRVGLEAPSSSVTPQDPYQEVVELPAQPKAREFPEKTTIYVMRHGHREDMKDRHWRQTADRPHDPPLSSFGNCQVRDVVQRQLGNVQIDRVVSSPFIRCIETAAWAAQQTGNSVICREEGIGEWVIPDLCPKGRVDTLTNQQLQEFLQQKFENLRICETYQSIGKRGQLKPDWKRCEPRGRLMQFIFKISRRYPHERILFVTHGDGLSEILSHIYPEQANAWFPGCADMVILDIEWKPRKKESMCSGVYVPNPYQEPNTHT